MELSIICPINSLGYGVASLHIIDELMNLGAKVNLFPIGRSECHPRHQQNIRQALLNSDTFYVDAKCVRIWHQHDMSMFVGHGEHIGFPIFELDTFTPKEKHHLSTCDRLFVCSHWAKDIIEKNGIDVPVNVVPLGVDNDVFQPKLSKRKPTVFLNVGKWEKRKGHDKLCDAFNLAFTPDDNVELWMMCENPFLTPEQTQEWKDKYTNTPLGDKIRFVPRVESDTEVAEIMRQADCGVFLSRAEGWNLDALEMLACGKQVIATNYSAHTEFLTTDNSFLLSIENLEVAYDGIWFHNQGYWAEITKDTICQCINSMRLVHDQKQKGKLKINKSGLDTAEEFSWTNTTKRICDIL